MKSNNRFTGWVVFLLCSLTLPGRADQVVFSELMYHPPPGQPEFIEVFNSTATPFDMAEWKLRGGVDYDFPKFSPTDPRRTFLKPFERILLSPVPEADLRAAYNIPASVRIYGPWTGNLDDAGERITLRDKNGVTMCTLAYHNRGHWPVAADGAGHSLTLKNAMKTVDDWHNWTFSRGRLGTPGTEVTNGPPLSVRLNEVHFSPSNTVDWVELFNATNAPLSLDGLALASRADFGDLVPLHGTLGGAGLASFNVDFPAGGEVVLYLIDSSYNVVTARACTRSTAGDSLQAFPDGSSEWYGTPASTRDAPNDPVRTTSVVINEIMYNPPSGEISGKYVELYNRSTNAVDLSGWHFTDGITFAFPAGTRVEPDTYLVVAADEAWMRSVYGAIPLLGNFEGQLASNGELLRLVDQWGNLVDEVDFQSGGSWPNLAHGGGTSLELRNPWLNNDLPSAWADSNETNKSTFAHYSYKDVFRQLTTQGVVTDYKELHLHLVGDSHVILRNIQLRLNGTGTNIITRGSTMSSDGKSANGWLAQGTHWLSHLDNGDLHLIADGHGDNRANRVEIDATAMQAGSAYEISFDARWVAGASRVIAQTWDHSIANSFSLPVPRNLGTPGFRNSRASFLPGPQVDQVRHSPAVPLPSQVVRITAAVSSVSPVSVQLVHRPDNANASAAWATKPMVDDGTGGDEVAGDGIYTAQLTEYPVNGQVVQFYVAATANGQTIQVPPPGTNAPAMYVVDTPTAAGDLRRMRFVLSAHDLAAIANQDAPTPGYGYAHPRLSNHYYNMTVIVNEQDIIYDCEVRTSGSPWTRGGNLDRGKFKFPRDQLIRGKEKQSYDNDAGGSARHHNRLMRYWLYLFGHPANENEYFILEVNNRGTALREEVEPLGNDMLDRIYPDGSMGELYRIDDEWWFTDDWNRMNRDADWFYKGSDNPGRYHSEWMKRTRENEYDYSSLVNLFKTISAANYTQSMIERIVDPIAVMKMDAIRGYAHDWDSFSLDRGKNGYLYRRPTDGRFMFFHWDSDLAFDTTSGPFYNGMIGFRPWLEKPYNFRLFKHYLATLVENYTKNSPRLTTWFQVEEEASSQYNVSTSTYQSWFTGREPYALTFLGANRTNVFRVASNGGSPITTSENTLSLIGVAPLRVFTVVVAGHPEATCGWTAETGWAIKGIILRSGTDTLTVQAVDDFGTVLATETVTVTKTGNAPPVMTLEADPASWHVSVLDQLTIDPRGSYDPDGGPLAFAWSFTPLDAQVDLRPGGQALASFPHPGLYSFTVTGTDAGGASDSITREAAVYAPDGFSAFDGPRLQSFWNLENLVLRENYLSGPYCSVTEIPGNLVLQVQAGRSYPLGAASAAYPFLWRTLPALTDWALLTDVQTRGPAFGDFNSGLLAEVNEGGAAVRYAFGTEDGTALTVRRVAGATGSTLLRSSALAASEAEIRIRREGDSLFFEQRTNETWSTVHTAGLPLGAAMIRGGVFLSTDTPQSIKTSFDYVILVDPSSTSDLRQSLRISEIMYNPPAGSDYEFIELVNIGTTALDLTGVRFTAGIDYTFGPTVLGPRQYLIVAKNRSAFASYYNVATLNLAPGEYLGQLSNGGETIELSDTNGVVFLSVTYGDSGAWPSEADGSGSSLEAASLSGNPNDPANWRASPEAGGSPGRPGGDALGTVIVNEVLAHSDGPFEDAIELFNRTAAPVNIGGWFLSDSKADFKKYRIPDNTIIPALGFKVFYEIDFNTNNPLVPFSLSSANGDQVYLSAADSAGNLTGYRSAVDFDPSASAVSFGRYETSVGRDFPPLSALTFGQDSPADLAQFRTGTGKPNAAPKVGPLVINELMYRPPDIGGTNDDVVHEFVELYNITGNPLQLFDSSSNTWHLRGGVDFDFPMAVTIAPRSFVLIVSFDPLTNLTELAEFRASYALPESVPLYGPYQGKLDNRGEEVKITRPDTPQTNGAVPHVLVDRVVYADSYPWPLGPDGGGQSLQRRRPHEYGNDPVNWKAAAPTPGQANQPGAGYLDTDADGLPDDYEDAYGFASNNAADATQDADGDGRTNYEEFLDGTNPRDAADHLVKPALTTSPQSQVLPAGATVTFTAAGTGTAPLFYQWRINGRSLPGATNANLVLPSAQGGAAGEYSVVLYNAAGFVISTGATLRIEEPLQILAQPQGHVVNRGSTVVFQVFAAGTGPLRYQWRRDGADLANATNSILTLTAVEPEASGNYSVVVSDNSGSLTSADATLSVLQPPTIVEQPQPQTAVAYTDVFFSVTAGGQGPFTYQWRLNGLAIPGATSSILGLPNVQPEEAGVYSVEVANPVASVVSANARLTLLIPVTIVQQPQSVNVVPGGTATFSVLAASSSTMTYQWRFNDVDMPSATNSTLTITNAQEANSGGYNVAIWDAISSVRSQVATLGIIIPLSFVALPLSQSVPEGGSVTLSAEVRGSPAPFGFEWRRLATVVVSNTSYSPKAFLTLTNLQLSNSSSYRLIVRSSANSVGIASVPLAQITVLPDFDHDGLPDLYEQSIGLNTNNAADAFTDLDNDGVSNYDEYLAGTDPLDPLSYLRVDEEIENGLTTILFPAGSNRTYTVEYTDDLTLGTWNKLDDLVAYPTNHIRRLIDPAASQNRFYRVITPRRP